MQCKNYQIYTPAQPFSYIVNRNRFHRIIYAFVLEWFQVESDEDIPEKMILELAEASMKHYVSSTLYDRDSQDHHRNRLIDLYYRVAVRLAHYRDDDDPSYHEYVDALSEVLENHIQLYPDYIELTGYEYYQIIYSDRVIVINCIGDYRIFHYHENTQNTPLR